MIKILHLINQCIQHIVHVVAPSYCVNCKQFLVNDTIFCTDCADAIIPIASTSLKVTAAKTIIVHALSAYEEPIKSLIIAKSWGNRLAAYQLGKILWEKTLISQQHFDIIVPVPLHWRRYAYRGYNQAEVIAQQISTFSGKPMMTDIKRVRNTPFLSSVKGSDRKSILSDVFILNGKKQYQNKHILVVDDLMTTGSTVRSLVKTLYNAQPANILVLVAAHTC
jgi:ComF family protein